MYFSVLSECFVCLCVFRVFLMIFCVCRLFCVWFGVCSECFVCFDMYFSVSSECFLCVVMYSKCFVCAQSVSLCFCLSSDWVRVFFGAYVQCAFRVFSPCFCVYSELLCGCCVCVVRLFCERFVCVF